MFRRICLSGTLSIRGNRNLEWLEVRTTMGSKIRPINGFGIEYRVAVSSIEATTTHTQGSQKREALASRAVRTVVCTERSDHRDEKKPVKHVQRPPAIDETVHLPDSRGSSRRDAHLRVFLLDLGRGRVQIRMRLELDCIAARHKSASVSRGAHTCVGCASALTWKNRYAM